MPANIVKKDGEDYKPSWIFYYSTFLFPY